MMEKVNNLIGQLKEVGVAGGNPLIILVMGFISDILLIVYKTGDENSAGKRAAMVGAYAMRQFEPELRKAVNDSPTPYDDKLVDELFEVVDTIL